MAIQDDTLTSAEHDWFATRSSLPTQAPLADHKLKYFADKGFGSNASLSKPLSQQEREWLQSVGSSASNKPFELWVNACQAQSITPGVSINDCKFKFYTGVLAGTNP